MSFSLLTVSEQLMALKSGQTTATELVEEHIVRIQAMNPSLNALVHTQFEKAKNKAKKIDEAREREEPLGALAGIPFTIKDLFNVKDVPTASASKILEGYVSPYDSTVANRLQSSGAILLAKNNQDEFAMGSRNQYSVYGECKNPRNLEYSPGGSSGGSTAAVAAGLSAFSIGSDTGGSVRQPAHFCGVVGMKPTYGRISRHGMIAFASSLDQAGVVSRSVEDSVLVLQQISGFDENDATSSVAEVPDWMKSLQTDLKGARVGICEELLEGCCEETKAAFEEVKSKMQAEGAELTPVDLSLSKVAVSVYYLIAMSEASSNLARYDGVRYGRRADFSSLQAEDLEDFYSRSRSEGFGDEVKRRLIMGTYFLSAGYQDQYYVRAAKVRRMLREQFLNAFSKVDFILSPVSNSQAPKCDQRDQSPLKHYLDDQLTVPASLAGLPAMSIPYAKFSSGLPMGMQVIGAPFDEANVFRGGRFIEQQAREKMEVAHVL